MLCALSRSGYDGHIVVDISGAPNIVEEAVKARQYFQSLLESL